ncbi:MAG TPA: hypothetical protein VGO88_06995 [Mycetocola sp.]|nr:hypothetical protein [Mycetocola sp.]
MPPLRGLSPSNSGTTLNRPLALLVAATAFMEILDGTIIQTAGDRSGADVGAGGCRGGGADGWHGFEEITRFAG